MTHPVPELLAPAGSLDAARAALANGADALYLGAERFNARDDGAQLTMEELKEACRLAHARGARVYLAFNVLMKPAELAEAMTYLGSCIDAGIDAAIVQDLGVVRLIRTVYPQLEVHGSTQMTIHDPSGARVMERIGVERVVLARENTLDDLRAIRSAVPNLGLESFVHGALCIAYSGQCFMSGMISERSANRGSCAQSCRKDYQLTDALTGTGLDSGYLISARDLAAAEHLDAIAEIGIGCLKIEGRKKKPEYVATVTQAYRGFLDRLAHGEWTPPTPADIEPLVQIFSRGFTGGMYGGRDGRDYVTRAQPDNRGTVLGRVLRRDGAELVLELDAPVGVGDGLGFEHPDGARFGNTGFAVQQVRLLKTKGGRVVQGVHAPTAEVPVGWIVVRSSHAALLETARASYADIDRRGPIPRTALHVTLSGRSGEPLVMTATADGETVVMQSRVALDTAAKHALDRARLEEQLGRLGETPFELGTLTLEALDDALFLPVSALNELRQQATEALMLRRNAARATALEARQVRITDAIADARRTPMPDADTGRLVASVWRIEDAEAAADAGADEIVLDVFLRHPAPSKARVRALAEALAARSIVFRLRTPTIVRPEERGVLDKWLALDTALLSGHLGLVAELAAEGRDVVADYGVNAFNAHTADLLFALGATRTVLSVELTTDELAAVSAPWQGRGFDIFVHGRPEGMTIEHCVLSAAFDREVTTCRDLCVQKHPHVELTDPAGYVFPVATDSACRNRLLHSRPVDATQYLPSLWHHGLRNWHCVFNVPGDPVAEVVAAYRLALLACRAGHRPSADPIRAVLGHTYTRGHFARAV